MLVYVLCNKKLKFSFQRKFRLDLQIIGKRKYNQFLLSLPPGVYPFAVNKIIIVFLSKESKRINICKFQKDFFIKVLFFSVYLMQV